MARFQGKVTEASPSLHAVRGACHQHCVHHLHQLMEVMLVNFLHAEKFLWPPFSYCPRWKNFLCTAHTEGRRCVSALRGAFRMHLEFLYMGSLFIWFYLCILYLTCLFLFMCMYVYVNVCYLHVSALECQKRMSDTLEVGVTGDWELPDIGSGKWIQLLFKGIKHPRLLSHLYSSCIWFISLHIHRYLLYNLSNIVLFILWLIWRLLKTFSMGFVEYILD